MNNGLTFDGLKLLVEKDRVDTVLVCFVDMQGRLMGKRFHAKHFIGNGWKETHCCNYLLATDLEMATPSGYASTSWQTGYGDYVMKPDLLTLRRVPWLDGTVMVLCDVLDHHGEEIPHSPRAVLKSQIKKLESLGFDAMIATELEFFLFEKSFDEIRKNNFQDLKPISAYNEDYHIFQTTKEEKVMRPLRNHLWNAGIPVENSKGEAEAGQEELNIRYAPAMLTADYHTIAKHASKEISWQQGHAITYMSKWSHDHVGSSAHIHQSLLGNGHPVFFDKKDKLGMSQLMKSYMAGQLKFAPEYTFFLAPYVNSYKRFKKGTFAPTRSVWSVDNRTAGFRVCGAGTKSVRVECRTGGSDLNPYLAIAALLAAGIKGIENSMELEKPREGDSYEGEGDFIPETLKDARKALNKSEMLRQAFGEEVIDHYVRAADWEIEDFHRVVTDYEVKRGFERS